MINLKNIIYSLLFLTFLSSLRGLFLPLGGDELQYAEVGKNIITKGTYFLYNMPCTFTPIMPFLVSLFYIKSIPVLGFALVKIFNILLMVIGLRYAYLFFKKIGLTIEIALIIVLLTAVNNIFLSCSSVIYPESVLFCFLWIYIYNSSKVLNSPKQLLFLLVPLVILILTRYLYAVYIPITLYFTINYFLKLKKEKKYAELNKALFIIFLSALPLIFWFKYVFTIESNLALEQSYFTRFKNNDLFYNIKSGLGIIQHGEVGKINGIPAFVSLFVPITGLRNWILSTALIVIFVFGLFTKWQNQQYKNIIFYVLLGMAGLVFAGTGFSRYWMVFLPIYWLGFYLFYKKMNFNELYFKRLAIVLSLIYVVNELRIDYLIFQKIFI